GSGPELARPNHPPPQTLGIKPRLANGNAIALGLIDNDFVRIGGRWNTPHLANDDAVIQHFSRIQQTAQFIVFRSQRCILEGSAFENEHPGFQLFVFPLQVITADKQATKPITETRWRIAKPVDRRKARCEGTSNQSQLLKTGIGSDQRCRHQNNEEEPETGHRPLNKDGLNGKILPRDQPSWENIPMPPRSMTSRALPPPRATQVRGSSAMITGRPVSSLMSLSRPRSKAPPPVSTIPRSAISEASSGGDCSRALFTVWTIWAKDSCRASRISSLFKVNARGTPSARLRPRTSISRTSRPS